MDRVKHSLVLIGSMLFVYSSCAAVNYYEFLGISPSANRSAIRAKCASVDVIRDKKEDLVSAEARRSPAREITDLKKDIATLIKKGKFSDDVSKATPSTLKTTCDVLRDAQRKAKHDKAIADEKAAAAKREREAQERERKFLGGVLGAAVKGTYYEELQLPETATDQEITARCELQKSELVSIANKKKVDRGVATTDAEKRKLDNEIGELEKKIANTNLVCGVLQDPKRRKEYDKKRAAAKAKGASGIFGSIKSAVNSAKKDADILLISILGPVLAKIPIPDAAATVFNQKLAMRNMRILQGPAGPNVRTGLGFTGTMFFNKLAVQGTVYVVENRAKKMEYSLTMALPEHYKISSMFPSFKKLDKLSLPMGKFILSSFEYYDPAGYGVKPGFNFIASLELTGPLAMINKLKDQAKKMKSVIVRAEPIFFRGVIPRDIKKTAFSAKIPIYIGVDFAKIPKMPKSLKSIFKEITTDDFEFAVTAPQLVFTIEGGVRLVLTTQREPIRLSMFGRLEPTSFSLGMRMRNMLELKWFALGNAGIQLDFDEALLPAAAVFGIPFTGIGLNGELNLGKPGEARAILSLAGGARVSSSKIPDLVFDAEARNIRFAHIINLASRIAMKTKMAKREIPVGDLPVINIERLRGYLSLEDTTIAQKEYPAGFAVEVDALILKHRAGFSIDFKHTAGTIKGDGYVSDIDVRAKGKKIFSLTGPLFTTKAGKAVTGPHIIFDFDVKKPTQGMFGVDGTFEIPAVDLRQRTHFLWRGWNLTADFETTYAGFTVLYGATINLKKTEVELPDMEGEESGKKAPPGKLQTMRLTFGFKGDFSKFLSEQARPAVEALKTEASAKLEKLNAEIAGLSKKISELGKKGEEATEAEIQRVRAKINEIKAKIEAFKKERAATKKAYKKIQLTAQINAQRTVLGIKEVYLQGLLKPGKRVIKGMSTAVASATKALNEAKLLKKVVEKTLGGFSKMLGALAKGTQVFQLKEAIGEFNSAEIKAGKLPKLTSLIVETNIPGLPKMKIALKNVQFDFKRPIQSAWDISYALGRGIRFSK